MISTFLRRIYLLAGVAFFAVAGCAAPKAVEDTETMPPPGSTAAATVPAGGPSQPAAATQGAFVGPVDGTDVLIGLVSDGKSVAAFATDGESLFTWARPAPIDGSLSELQDRETGAFLGGIEFYEDGVRGELFVDHTPFSFEAAPATGQAGIQWAGSGDAESGWVTGNDGSVRGAKNQGGKLANAGSPQGPVLADPSAEAFKPR